MNETKQSTIVRVVILLIIALGIGAWAYWHYVISNPSRIFSNMLNNSLSTTSVTKQIIQSQGDQKLNQFIQLTNEPVAQTHGVNVLDQGSGTVVTTESVGLPKADYVRYNSIVTEQKTVEGKDFNFNEVLGLWGKIAESPQTGTGPQLYSQSVLGVVPMASLNATQRKSLIDQIMKDNVYQVDYSHAVRTSANGRISYSYPVTLDPVVYIKMLKTFAGQIGMHELDDVSESDYAGTQPLKFVFKVDALSGQLTQIVYVNEEDPENPARIENYSAYGARVLVPEPAKSIPLQELQGRLQRIQ